MKHRLPLILLLVAFSLVAGSAVQGVSHQVYTKSKPEMIIPIDPDQYGGPTFIPALETTPTLATM